MVLDNVQTVVTSLEFVELRDGRLTVRYNKGHNEECPECVPDHDMVRQMMQTSLSVHARYVSEVDCHLAGSVSLYQGRQASS